MIRRSELRPLVIKWNHEHSWENFKTLYNEEFDPKANPAYRVWHIFRNTCLNGRYKLIEEYEDWYCKI